MRICSVSLDPYLRCFRLFLRFQACAGLGRHGSEGGAILWSCAQADGSGVATLPPESAMDHGTKSDEAKPSYLATPKNSDCDATHATHGT